jgi:hypothetical protein
MRFMLLRKADERTEAGELPTEALLAVMGEYMEAMVQAGILLGGEGLQPTSKAVRVTVNGGKPIVIDGPFAETKELVAGYCLIQVASLQDAIEWVKRWPPMDDAVIEIRQLFEADDFGAEFTPELRENEERLRDRLEGKA